MRTEGASFDLSEKHSIAWLRFRKSNQGSALKGGILRPVGLVFSFSEVQSELIGSGCISVIGPDCLSS